MTYRWYGGSTPGSHCGHCPLPTGHVCKLNCSAEYAKLQEERKKDGITVIDEDRPEGYFTPWPKSETASAKGFALRG